MLADRYYPDDKDGPVCDELLGDVERQLTLAVARLPARQSGHILCRLQAVLPLFPAFKRVAQAQVKLRLCVDVIRTELVWLKDGQELRVPGKHGIRSKVCGDFLRLTLQDRRSHSLERMVVLQGKPDRVRFRFDNAFMQMAASGKL